MTGYQSKKAMSQDKLNDDDDTQVYGDAVDNNPVHEAMLSYWGERCTGYHEECVCCQAWEQYDGKTSAQPAQDSCFCHSGVSLQMVSGGAAPEGYLGWVTLLIDGAYVDYVRARLAQEQVARISVLETALNKIAYAGMSASQEMSNDYKQAWHASRAWEFIGIAAQAIDQESTPVQEPTLQEQLEKAKADWRKAYAEIERIEKLMEKNND